MVDEPKKYLALCLDPVHIGTGGYRLGRVDMSIVREAATGVPKIPGTSLAGAIRAYAEMAKGQDTDLPNIDMVFGTKDGGQGMLRFYDGDVVLFPVSSHLGTVWISTSERLTKWLSESPADELLSIPNNQVEDKVITLKGLDGEKPVHLGWLLLETEPVQEPVDARYLPRYLDFIQRLVLVSDKLFHHLVNDHLEVRTSVAIDDETGAAQTGALFTYEAIPRGTIIGLELATDTRRGNGVSQEKVDELLRRAFTALKVLGIGGMGTRGFGRLEVFVNGTTPEATNGGSS